MKTEHHIAIKNGELTKDVAKITYMSSGGFVINDLLRTAEINEPTWIAKMMADNLNHGFRTTKALYTAFTTGQAKYSHHADGRAQISGTGVMSGFEEGTKKPKGASVHSFALNTTNDTGPFAGFQFWGLEHYPDAEKDSILIDVNERMIHPKETRELNAYVLKFFYILKKDFTPDYLAREKIWYRSKIELWVDLYVIPSPEKEPGVIGVYVTRGHNRIEGEAGYSFSGAPGKKEGENGRYSPTLVMIYPFEGKVDPRIVNLNWPQPTP